MNALIQILASLTPIQAPSGLPRTSASQGTLQHILQAVFGVAGALALLFIVVSGLRYITSDGDPADTAKARGGIIYALVGLAICVVAEALVAFVVNRV